MTNFARIRELARQEERLRWAVERQRAKCTRKTPTYSDGPRGSGGGQRMEEDTIRLVMLKDQLEHVREELEPERALLQRYVKKLKDGTQRAAMEMRYMKAMGIIEIGDTMGYSERQVRRILKRAESLVLQREKASEDRRKRCPVMSGNSVI